jgi:LmbE family N-acetylglucosaminyl deacetylase
MHSQPRPYSETGTCCTGGPVRKDVPERVLVIMAHPDDTEDFCGGTVALWARAGSVITIVLVTSGGKGCKNLALSPAQVSALREQEHHAAAKLLGIDRTVLLREPDGEVLPTLALRCRLMAEVRRYKPDVVVLPDPTRYFFDSSYINHPDHRAAGEAALSAISPGANNRRYFPELLAQGLEPHQVREIWLAIPTDPNRFVDITGTLETKIAAFLCHDSQVTDSAQVRERMLRSTISIDSTGQVSHREAFRVMVIG